MLPDRFDSQGRPLGANGRSVPRWTSRQGTFERRPHSAGGWRMQGNWGVAGTDDEEVERLAKDVRGALDGGWVGVLGLVGKNLLAQRGGHTEQLDDRDREDDGEERRRHRRR